MVRPRRLVSAVCLAALFGAATFPAAADMPCAPMMGAGQGMHGQGAEGMARHHARLHEALKLNAEQEAAWQKMLAAEHPPGMDRPAAATPEEWARLTTPERAERMLERMQAHQARMSEHVAALKSFYATLSPAQQKIFDDAHRGGATPRGHHRHGQRPGGMPMISPTTS